MTKLTMSDGNITGQTVIDNMIFSFGDPIPVPPTPVPEPQTYVMLLAGLGLLGFAVRKKGA